MKKKEIEKIPYLTLPKTSRKKDVKYIGVTAIKKIAHEEHLFLEVYRNQKSFKDVPLVRIVCTKKDFGNFFPETGKWTRQKISDISVSMLWESKEEKNDTGPLKEKKNILSGQEDLERLKKYSKQRIWREERWWEYVQYYEEEITRAEKQKTIRRKRERRQQALDDRIANTPILPEGKVLEDAEKRYFQYSHYLFYKKRGSWAKIACTNCGKATDGRWRGGESYESQFHRWVEEPRDGQIGKCPMCGEHGVWKCQGRVKTNINKTKHIYLGQKYKKTGYVMRYIEVSKEWYMDLTCDAEKDVEMIGAGESLSGIEIARAYFEDGKPVQIDFHKYNPYTGKDFWDDCNLYGNASITIGDACVMYQTYEEMRGTILQYSALREFTAAVREVNPIRYFQNYICLPQIEMLVKLDLIKTVEEIIKGYKKIVMNPCAKRPDQFLGIRKDRVKQLIQSRGNIELLEVMQMEKRMNQNWTEKQIEHLAEIRLDRRSIEFVMQYMSLQQLLNRIEKYAGCEYGTGCSRAIENIRHTARIYIDYLNMRQELGYDLHNTVYQYPRDLMAAHNKMVMEQSKEECEKRTKEVRERYPAIRKNYRRLRNMFFHEDENYFIRPARSAEEIVAEGRTLHHCVGRDNYLGRHNRGEAYILMLRDKKNPEMPYITVEIGGKKLEIIQWYGAYDEKPDKENMEKWLDNYITKLKCKTTAESRQKIILQAM